MPLFNLYRIVFLLSLLLSAAGCHENYLVRADLFQRVEALPAGERAGALIAARREDDTPVYLKLASITDAERVGRDVHVRTGNGLKTAAVTFGALAALHALVGGITWATGGSCHSSGDECIVDPGPVFGISFLSTAALLGLVAGVLGLAGHFSRPAESAAKPRFDAAAGVLRF